MSNKKRKIQTRRTQLSKPAFSFSGSSLITGRRVVSKPGAVILVQEIELSEAAKQRLTTTASSLSGAILPRRRKKKA